MTYKGGHTTEGVSAWFSWDTGSCYLASMLEGSQAAPWKGYMEAFRSLAPAEPNQQAAGTDKQANNESSGDGSP